MTPEGQAQLKIDEGRRFTVYDDRTGRPVVRLPSGGNATIGYGRNLTGRGITSDEADMMLDNDLAHDWQVLLGRFPWLAGIPPVWQDVVEMVQFNTGNVGNFAHMLAAMQRGDARTAADELMDSGAARQLHARYQRMSDAVVAGAWV